MLLTPWPDTLSTLYRAEWFTQVAVSESRGQHVRTMTNVFAIVHITFIRRCSYPLSPRITYIIEETW